MVIAGPTGAGKTSSTLEPLGNSVGPRSFSADVIAEGLSGVGPEVAPFLRVKADATYTIIDRHALLGFKVGRFCSLRQNEIDKWVDEELGRGQDSGMQSPCGETLMTAAQTRQERDTASRHFVDLFAGCGGLSLGLMSAGWQGLFAVEQDANAFETLKHNLVEGQPNCPFRYAWPDWLEKTPIEISHFIKQHRVELAAMKGKVDLVAGGPPCQGFSVAGRRNSKDPRNELFKHYVALVKLLEPPFLLLENVKGISFAFRKPAKGKKDSAHPAKPFSERIKKSVERAGYNVFTKLVRGTEVGVPQFRPRYIMLAIRRDLLKGRPGFDPFNDFDERRKKFLQGKGLPVDRPVTVRQAISDLEKKKKKIIECTDSSGFKQIEYKHPRSKYQRLLHGTLNGTAPNSLRLARHGKDTTERFRKILSTCRKGVQLSPADRERFDLKKHCVVPLHPHKPSHTLTTLPDDFLHYSEPRILTVREYARLQSFPDWYDFKGKYTTGGDRRLRECPRYTQAGNAVPPFLAAVVGLLISDLKRALTPSTELRGPPFHENQLA